MPRSRPSSVPRRVSCSAVEAHAWDGSWYLRNSRRRNAAGLGSKRRVPARLDRAIVGRDLGSRQPRANAAGDAVSDRPPRPEDDRLILLLDPPFDQGALDPGYIKGYPPGIRENGAQYTHAAAWVVQATAMLGQGELAHHMFRLLNPLEHSTTHTCMQSYKVEPYVMAGDVYSTPPHAGRGGWTWYTGAAGWLYRIGLERLLGLRRSGDFMCLDPCVPPSWNRFVIAYRFRSATYTITFENALWPGERCEQGPARWPALRSGCDSTGRRPADSPGMRLLGV